MFGNDRQYVVVVQNDGIGGKLHAHIVGNSVDFKNGRSLCGEKTGHKHLMRVSDELQEKYGVKNKNIDCDYKKTGKNTLKSHNERKLIQRSGYSWKKSLEDDINKSINATRKCSAEEIKILHNNSRLDFFLKRLNFYGITYKIRKTSKCDSGFSITYTYIKNEKEYKVRDYKLCDELTYKNLQKLIDNDFVELEPEPAPPKPKPTKVKIEPQQSKKTSQPTKPSQQATPKPKQQQVKKIESTTLKPSPSQSKNPQLNQKTTPTTEPQPTQKPSQPIKTQPTQSINQLLRKSKVTPKNNSKPKTKNNDGPDF